MALLEQELLVFRNTGTFRRTKLHSNIKQNFDMCSLYSFTMYDGCTPLTSPALVTWRVQLGTQYLFQVFHVSAKKIMSRRGCL
jgi:hypothetical protein